MANKMAANTEPSDLQVILDGPYSKDDAKKDQSFLRILYAETKK